MNYFERQEGYSWGIGCVFRFWMKQDMSFVSEWKKRKRKGKVDIECDFHIGVKVNEDKWVLWEEEEEKEEKEEERMQLIYIMFKKNKKHQSKKRQMKR